MSKGCMNLLVQKLLKNIRKLNFEFFKIFFINLIFLNVNIPYILAF